MTDIERFRMSLPISQTDSKVEVKFQLNESHAKMIKQNTPWMKTRPSSLGPTQKSGACALTF